MVSGNRDNCILELKETPFLFEEGRFFVMKRASPCIKETPPLFANNGFHSPLHSERGWGRGSSLFANICLFNNEKIINSFFFRTFAVG